jgi:hypothetical protein
VIPASLSVRKIPHPSPYQRWSLSPPSPQRSASTHLIGSLVVAGDIIVIGGRGARGIGRACILELFEDDLGDRLAHGNSRATEFSLAEVVASRVVMVVFYLALLQGEVASVALAGEVMAVSMVAATSVGTSIRHLVPEEAVVAGNAAPS